VPRGIPAAHTDNVPEVKNAGGRAFEFGSVSPQITSLFQLAHRPVDGWAHPPALLSGSDGKIDQDRSMDRPLNLSFTRSYRVLD
jgi:hypothetical protein